MLEFSPKYEGLDMSNYNFPVRIWHGHSPIKYNENGHWHEHIELWFLRDGNVDLKINNTQYEMKNFDLAVVNPSEIHSISFDSTIFYDCLVISPLFMQSGIGRDNLYGANDNNLIFKKSGIGQTFETGDFILKNHIRDPKIKEFFDRIIEESEEKKVAFDLAILSSICDLLVYLYRNHMATIPNDDGAGKHDFENIKPAIKYLTENYTTDISYVKLAQICNINPHYFCKQFKKLTGKSVISYINELRISQSKFLMRNTKFSVTEIAFTVGYNDANYFSRIFKKVTGVSPTKFRENILKKEL